MRSLGEGCVNSMSCSTLKGAGLKNARSTCEERLRLVLWILLLRGKTRFYSILLNGNTESAYRILSNPYQIKVIVQPSAFVKPDIIQMFSNLIFSWLRMEKDSSFC